MAVALFRDAHFTLWITNKNLNRLALQWLFFFFHFENRKNQIYGEWPRWNLFGSPIPICTATFLCFILNEGVHRQIAPSLKHTLGFVSITHHTISIHRGLPAWEDLHAHGSALGERLYISTSCQFTVCANRKSVRPR